MFFVPIPRAVAIERGLNYFQSHKPCKENSIAKRKVSNKQCTCEGCKKRASLASMKSASKNRSKINARERARYKQDPSKGRAKSNKWATNNKAKRSASHSIWHANNKDYANAKSREWYANNKEDAKRQQKQYRELNLSNILARNMERRKSVKIASVAWDSELTSFVLNECYSLNKLREELTYIKWQTDHMIPLQGETVCGLHVWNNFQCLPQNMNTSKRNKFIYTNPHEWLYDIPKFFKVVYQQEKLVA